MIKEQKLSPKDEGQNKEQTAVETSPRIGEAHGSMSKSLKTKSVQQQKANSKQQENRQDRLLKDKIIKDRLTEGPKSRQN